MDQGNIGPVRSERDTYIGSNVQQTIYEAPEPSKPIIKPLHQLRPPVADFVGRQSEIDQLVQALGKANNGTATIRGTRGLGGMGKTQLALAVAQHLKATYPDAQLLIELRGTSDNPLTPEQALQTTIRAFEPLAQLPDNLSELRSTYLTLLNGKRVLILADDARDAKQVEPLLPPPSCALLLTSRQRFSLPGMQTLDLDVLSQSEAEKLLLDIYLPIGSAAPRMAQLCGRLPLALRLCAGTCAYSTMTIEYHLKALEDERERLSQLRDPDDPNTSVEASLRLSYTALDPQVQQTLCQLSIFPASFDIDAARVVVQVPRAEGKGTTTNQQPIEGLLNLLYRRSLLEWDRQTRRYSLHDLVRVFGVDKLEEGEAAVRISHAQHYARVAAQADDLFRRGGENLLTGLKLFDQERANIDAGWNWAREQLGSTSTQIDELLLGYANATIFVGGLRYDKRQELIPQLEAAIGAAQRLRRKGSEGSTLGNLGVAYADLGETRKAMQYHEQVLEITREIGDRRGQGSALGNLGHAYMDLGENRKAIQYYEQALEITREIGNRRGEGGALGSLGVAYEELGENRKAIQYYEQALEITREIGDRQTEAITSWNLGELLAEEGDLAIAIELMQITVDFEREVGHTNAEEDAAQVEELRKRLA
jgi:tetratricopeptide (TPR) repeat protein